VQLYRYFVSQSSEFCRHNPLCCFSTSVCCLFRYRLSPETFGYTLVVSRLRAGPLRFVSRLGQWSLSFATVSRPALEPTQPRI